MLIQTKIAIFLGGLLIAIAAVYFYGSHQYSKGFDQANLKATARAEKVSEEYRKKEQDWQTQAKQKDDAYDQAKANTQSAVVTLTSSNLSLRNAIADYKRRLSQASSSSNGTSDKGEIGIDLFAECSDKYSELAKETARLADKVNAQAGYLVIGR